MKISIVVPAHNEGENIEYVLKDILNLNLVTEVIIVDDHSVDNTYEISNRFAERYNNIKIVQRKGSEKGMGIALREGTLVSSGEIVIWMMADRSDDIGTVPLIINKIESGFDLVFASRYMRGGSAGDLNRTKAFLSSSYSLSGGLRKKFS